MDTSQLLALRILLTVGLIGAVVWAVWFYVVEAIRRERHGQQEVVMALQLAVIAGGYIVSGIAYTRDKTTKVVSASAPVALTDLTISEPVGNFGSVSQNAPDAKTNPSAWIYVPGDVAATGDLNGVAANPDDSTANIEATLAVVLVSPGTGGGGGGGGDNTEVVLGLSLVPVAGGGDAISPPPDGS